MSERDLFGNPINNEIGIPFEAFWAVYPVRKAKPRAKSKWAGLPLKDQQAVMNQIPHRLKHDPQWQSGFIPYAGTYLHQRRWEDEYQVTKITNFESMNDSALIKLCDEHGIRTAGKSKPQLVQKLKGLIP